uniref:Uncharacterized protein n=1 Tax=Oryza punctata TaxID=4537 RepID=A0A0E0L2Y6_ORYPU
MPATATRRLISSNRRITNRATLLRRRLRETAVKRRLLRHHREAGTDRHRARSSLHRHLLRLEATNHRRQTLGCKTQVSSHKVKHELPHFVCN